MAHGLQELQATRLGHQRARRKCRRSAGWPGPGGVSGSRGGVQGSGFGGGGGGGKRGLLARKAERAPHPMGCGLSPRCPVTGSFHSRLAAPEMGSDLPLQAVRQSFHSGKDSLRQRVCTLCP